MRYEFERDGTVVASVLWEGPGQVTVETAEPSTRAVVDRYLSSEVVYLGSGFDFAEEQTADVLQLRRHRGDRAGVGRRLELVHIGNPEQSGHHPRQRPPADEGDHDDG